MMAHATPLRILLVEDEALIAMDLEMTIADAGHEVVATAASLSGVMRLMLDQGPDLAFVDMQLAKGSTGLEVNDFIMGKWPGTMVVFLTANPMKVPEGLAGAVGVIAKPFTTRGFLGALSWLQGHCQGESAEMALPYNLTLAPHLAVART